MLQHICMYTHACTHAHSYARTHTHIYTSVHTCTKQQQTLTVARGLVSLKFREVGLQFEFALIYLLLQNVLLV